MDGDQALRYGLEGVSIRQLVERRGSGSCNRNGKHLRRSVNSLSQGKRSNPATSERVGDARAESFVYMMAGMPEATARSLAACMFAAAAKPRAVRLDAGPRAARCRWHNPRCTLTMSNR
jgi:hypothetical protein